MIVLAFCAAMVVAIGFRLEKLASLRPRRGGVAAPLEEWRSLEVRANWWFFAGWCAGWPAWAAAAGLLPLGGAPLALMVAVGVPAIAGASFSGQAKRLLEAARMTRKEAEAALRAAR